MRLFPAAYSDYDGVSDIILFTTQEERLAFLASLDGALYMAADFSFAHSVPDVPGITVAVPKVWTPGTANQGSEVEK